MIDLTGIRRVTYKDKNKKINTIDGHVTINNDVVTIKPYGDNDKEITMFKERIIKIERVLYGEEKEE